LPSNNYSGFHLTQHIIASALRGVIKTHEISVKMIKKTSKTIRDIIDSKLEKDNTILIVFGINISDITCHQVAV